MCSPFGSPATRRARWIINHKNIRFVDTVIQYRLHSVGAEQRPPQLTPPYPPRPPTLLGKAAVDRCLLRQCAVSI